MYNRAWIRQIKNKAIMTKEGSTKIVNFITNGAGGRMLGRGYMRHFIEYALSSIVSMKITCHCSFNLFYDLAADMKI